MTDFAVTGKKGSGKGLFCAGLIRDALLAGKKVATNMDFFPEYAFGATFKGTYLRLPDCPTVHDFEALGLGNEDIDESNNGIIVLDETSKFFNSRAWGDKERQPLLDWLIHSRKLGWDVYYQMQGLDQVDKQVRTTQVEYHVQVKRTDKWPIPFVTPFLGLFGLTVRFPKMHIGVIRHGCDPQALVVERKWYKAKDLYQAYDTRQVFLDRDHPDACGLHTVLSPWYIKGRYMDKVPPKWLRFVYALVGKDWCRLRPGVGSVAYEWAKSFGGAVAGRVLKPKLPEVLALMELPEEERLENWHRLAAKGAFDRHQMPGMVLETGELPIAAGAGV